MKKKLVALSLVLMFVLALAPQKIFANENVKLWINGNYVSTDVAPFIENGRTLVPVRVISETLGYKVSWSSEEEKVSIFLPEAEATGNGIFLYIGSTEVGLSETETTTIDVSPKIVNGRTFVPIRFIAEQFGQKVDWDGVNKTVIIGDGYVAPVEKLPVNNNNDLNLSVSPYPDRQIKGNINSKKEKIYHCPNWPSYNKTKINESKGERWFASQEEAKAAGWRPAQDH